MMSGVEYLMIFLGSSAMACLVFAGLFQNHKNRTGKSPPPQTLMVWALLCLMGVLTVVTVVQVVDRFHVSTDERMKQMGIG
jgi:hypothetical protein